jgi:hypothetical protein
MQMPKQFSLRSSIVIVTLFAIAFAHQSRQDLRRRELVSKIQDAGGSVVMRDTPFSILFPTRQITSVSIPYWSMDDFTDDQLDAFPKLDEIVVLDFQCSFPKEENLATSGTPNSRPGLTGMHTEKLSISPGSTELLQKIRDRTVPISLTEVISGHPKVVASKAAQARKNGR